MLRVKQPAIVGRQSDRGVAFVDRAAQVVEDGPVARRRGRESVSLVLAVPDIEPDPVAQAVVIVPAVIDREQVAVFGVKDEQQPVEKDQRRVPHVLQRGWHAISDRARQQRVDILEHEVRQVGRDTLFVELSLFEGADVESPRIGRRRQERLPAKHQREHAKGVAPLARIELKEPVAMPGNAENGGKVEFAELLGHRPRAGIVKAPLAAVRKDAPAQVAGRKIVNAPQIAEHLR